MTVGPSLGSCREGEVAVPPLWRSVSGLAGAHCLAQCWALALSLDDCSIAALLLFESVLVVSVSSCQFAYLNGDEEFWQMAAHTESG